MDNFDDEEKFYRKVPPNPNMIKQNGTITSAAFKDSKGCSVDCKKDRDESDVIRNFICRFKDTASGIEGVADVSYRNCLEADTTVLSLPEDDNNYHCEIHKSKDEVVLTPGQAKRLARACRYRDIEDVDLAKIE